MMEIVCAGALPGAADVADDLVGNVRTESKPL
jgi:hypothetical protein